MEMGYRIEKLRGEPIIIETWDANYDPAEEGPKASQEIIRMMDTINEPTVVIVDMRAMALTFNDILLMAQAASSRSAPAHHPLQRRRIIITDSSIVSLAAQGLDSELFGRIKVDIATSMDEALEIARQ
jgi:hypothetical protein